MHSQDSPRPGRTSPITISAPATARGRVPLTARSAASGRSVQYVGDANPDTLVSSQPNRSANTANSASQPTSRSHSPTRRCAGRVCAIRAAPSPSPKCEHPRLRTSIMNVPDLATHHGDQHALSHRLSGDMFFYLRHLGTSTHFDFFWTSIVFLRRHLLCLGGLR